MIAVLTIPKIKIIILTHASLLHNGCALEVIMKMYRPYFYYQIAEQLLSKTMGPVMTHGGRQGSDRGWVLDHWESLRAGSPLRSPLMPSRRLPNLILTYASSFQALSLALISAKAQWTFMH